MQNKNQFFGKIGEETATKFLKKNKYKILERNYRTCFGEIDIIAKQKDVYVFVEVKSRKSDDWILPNEAVNFLKQNHIINSAERYLDDHNLFDVDYRFDIIEIVGEVPNLEINHIEDAFA